MNNQENTNEQQWKLLVLLLKEIAIDKHGTGWQTHLADKTKFAQSNISRMFGLKYTPSLKNYLIIAKALDVNFFFESKDSDTDLNQCFERAMEALGRRPDKLPKN
ncbi:helix-turn-helix transcriptional regulator [Sediminibacter sp. Hel_I_10]|uniref:helix-turn-helix domain-containing protein n=1 Tax=Sediminibacter sp. Hel_I_10 TaxID=1392490 RepID=UPI00047D5851|nr:helix-turn-helix transcriptional regulator [Sediminibacter sp. Hel_I_10]